MALGEVIKRKRELKEESLAEVARRAGISPAYLSKLENDDVRQPSPHVLHRLGDALSISYADLMALVGYLMPAEGSDGDRLTAAMFADVTEQERGELLAYLRWYRSRRDERPGK